MRLKKKLALIPVGGMTRDEWLAERRKSIGGSDAAAIIGLTPYATAYTVWADKTGRLPERADNEAMRQGRDFEQYVAERFTELTGKKTHRVNAMIKNPDYPFAAANIDRAVVGEAAGLECKTTSVLNLRRFRDGEFPESYYCQCVHYLAVTEFDRWYLAVLILNKGFMVYRLTRVKDDPLPEWCTASLYVSDDEIAALMSAERELWAMVEADTPPPLSGTAPDSDALAAIYGRGVSDASPVLLSGRDETVRRYMALKEQIKTLDAEAEQCKQQLMADLGENESGQTSDYNVIWKAQTRSSFDAKAFARDNPDIDLSGYFKVSSFRKFDIKPIKA